MIFSKCNYSIQDLEQFRDENGFIDLDKAAINLEENSKELRGAKEKYWVDFNRNENVNKRRNRRTKRILLRTNF